LILVIVGLVVFFALGFWVSRLVIRGHSGGQAAAVSADAVEIVPVDNLGLVVQAASGIGVSGFGSEGGMEVFAGRLSLERPARPARLTRTLSGSSAISSELARLGTAGSSLESRTKDLYRVIIRDGDAGDLMKAAGGGRHGAVVDQVTGRIKSQAILKPASQGAEVVSAIAPQAVWGLAAFAVGQHFEAEIASHLQSIENKLDHIIQEKDREDLAELAAAREECLGAAYRILDGEHPKEALADFSAQRQAIRAKWSLARTRLAAAEEKLAELEKAEGLSASQVGEMWEELFGEEACFSRDVRLFLSALAAKVELISLLAVRDAAEADPFAAAGAYRTRLATEMSECHQALEELRSIVHRTVRLEYSLGMSEWTPASVLFKGRKDRSNRFLATLRTLIQLEDQLDQLHLPFAGVDVLPQYDLIAERMPDGSLEMGLTRVVTPVVADLS
jgi:hypothetical protein